MGFPQQEGDVAERTQDEKIDDMLRYYHGVVQELREAYAKAAQPYINKIIEIEAMRPRRVLIDPEVYRQMMEPKPPVALGSLRDGG